MIATLQDIDRSLLYWINKGWSTPWLDAIAPIWRDKLTWIPVYLVLLLWLLWKYKKQAWPYILVIGLTVICCDIVSSSIIKPWVARLRPCNHPDIAQQINVLIHCGPGKSFTSSHATNHFGLSVALGLLFGSRYRWVWPVALVWAASIALMQVYVGVHYPFDILAGALLGSSIAVVIHLAGRKTILPRTFAS